MFLQSISLLLGLLFGFISGGVVVIAYILTRMTRASGLTINSLNKAERLLSHVVLHPEDLGNLYYLPDGTVQRLFEARKTEIVEFHRPFYYMDEDEPSELQKSRP